jgi:hypothetical protein
MNENIKRPDRGRAIIRWLVAAAFLIAVALSGLFTGMMNRAGLLFLLLGIAASVLTGFSRTEIGAAFRYAAGRPGPPEDRIRTARVWEAAARNAWILGVLGSVLNFTMVLGGGGSKGLADISGRMIQSFVVTLYGLVLAVVFLVPAMKLAGPAGKAGYAAGPKPASRRSLLFERVTGYALLAVVFGLTFFSLVKSFPPGGPLPAARIMLHGPAALVIFGGAIALTLFLGTGTGARALTFGFGMTGLIALLLGLIQAMFGFVHADIKEISAAVAFIISASLYALLGLVLIAAPLEDRELMDGRRERPGRLSRMLWGVFPLLAFLFLILTWIMVITPMRKAGLP